MTNFKSPPGDKGGIEAPAATFRPLTIVELPVEVHVPSALNVIAALKVAWASTAAVYTNSEDVVFRVRVSNSNTICPVKTHRVVLDPQQSVDSALASMTASGDYDGPLPPTHSPMIENVLTIHCTLDEHEKAPYQAPYDEKCAGVHVTLVKNTCISQIQANISRDVPLVRMMLAQFVYAIKMIARAYSDNHYLPHIHHLQKICPDGVSKLSRWNLNCPQREEIRVSELIEKQAQRHPDATAICAWDGSWTYGELVRRAYTLVQRILVRGVVPGQYVGLLLPKSKWTPVAMLAIVKSNCAFVLLNPARPKAYLTSICTQLKVQTLIYSVELESLAMDLGVADTILLAGEQNGPAQVGDPSLCREHPAEAGSGSAMYACFTSGSTGGPKGFAVDHASFCSGIKEYIKAVGLTPESRVFQFAPYDFAVSITDQLVPLTMGACVCIPSEGQLESDLEGAIHQLQANWLKLTPSLARTLELSRVSTVRTLLFVGEESLASDFQRWQARGVDLYGLYGQSENSKGTMVARRAASSDPCNIGFPYHAIGWIVDPNDVNRLMPVGAPGELLLESASLAQGYIGREEETQSTFVGRPTWREQVLPCSPGSRFLRTGDLVRYEPEDGSFCLLGRQGNRVKIRGQRLELGQVENSLHECIPARGLIIAGIIHPRAAKEPMLVAFVAGSGSKGSVKQDEDLFPAPTDEFRHEAREALRKLHHLLPSFMVPNTLLPISFIPRTATGKVHRRHLYEQASGLSQSELFSYVSSRPCYRPPQTGDEVKLQRACAQVLQLGVECVGMEDNFIELGGHSLTAGQLVSVARADGLQLRLSQVLQQPTLAALAQDAGKRPVNMGPKSTEGDPFRSLREHVRRQAIPGIDMSTVEDVLPTLHSQMAFARDQCVDSFVFRVDGPLDSVLLGEAWTTLVNKLPILRTVFPTIQGEIVQLVLREIPSSINVVKPAGTDGVVLYAQKLCKAGLETHYRVDSPTVQLTLVQAPADPGASALILRLCHAQYDGMCLEKLMHSLFAAYHNRSIEVQSDFAQYTHACRQLRTPEAMSFWRQLLTDASPTQLGASAHCSEPDPILSSMRRPYTRDIPNLPTPRGFTLATCVKAAWSWVLRQETGHNDVVFSQLGSCRESVPLPAGNSIIGPCINSTPVRVQYRPGMTGSEVLAAVQAQHAQAMDFDVVGMDDIVEGCTSWPAGTEPDTLVVHESFKVDWELADGDLVCRKTNAYFSTHPCEKSVLMTLPSKHGMKANLAASRALTREHAVSIIDMFSQAFVRLVSSPDSIL